MDKKYYTPNIEEFNVGFEYEIRDWWTKEGAIGCDSGSTPAEIERVERYISNSYRFTKRILTKEMLLECRIRSIDYRHEWERITMGIKDGNIRVKYLDDEDIKMEGFKAEGVDMAGNHTYENEKLIILVRPHLYSRVEIAMNTYPNRSTYFDGEIKNKSELKKILNQIKCNFRVAEPPLGIIPLWAHHEKRLNEIDKAIGRYKEANYQVPKEWYIEKSDLTGYISAIKPSGII